MKESYIYIITDGEAFKVGISKEPKKRIKNLQTGNPRNLELLETFKLPKSKVYNLERKCHKKLQTKFIKKGEWFYDATHFHVRIIVDEICDKYLIKDSN